MRRMCGHGEVGRCGYCAQDEAIAQHNRWRATKGLPPITASGARTPHHDASGALAEGHSLGDLCDKAGSVPIQ